MKQTYITLTVRLVVNHKEGLDQIDEEILVDEIVSELEYEFKSDTNGVSIEDTDITDYEIVKSIDKN